MSPTRAAITAMVLALSAPFVLAGEQTSPPPAQQRPPVFRGESVLVTVDVYPQREGKVVEGLTADDFQIMEDGKPQAVETVEFVRVEPSLSEATRRDPNSVSEMLKLAADPHNRVFVVFLDQLHVMVDGSYQTRRPMVDSLNRIIGPEDLFGVMTQNTDPRNLTFGRRLISVEEQLTKYWSWGERYGLTDDKTDLMEGTLRNCFQYKPPSLQEPLPPWFVDDNGQRRLMYQLLVDRRREDRTLTALESLVDRLGGLRDARTVALVVTEGWRLFSQDRALANQAAILIPTGDRIPGVGTVGGKMTLGNTSRNANGSFEEVRTCTDELVRLANLDDERRFKALLDRANRANVSFYPINPAGLTAGDMPMSAERTIGGTQGGKPIAAHLGPADPIEDGARLRRRADAMRTLAENTDGIAIVNTNDIAAGMKKIVDDVSAYYLLGYYSTNTTHDGRYRTIQVKSRTPGLNIRARRGYYAPNNKPVRDNFTPAPGAAEPPRGLEDALGELSRLRPSAALFVRGQIAGEQAQVVVELASARSIVSPWSGGADVQVIVTPDDGGPLAPMTAKIEAGARGALVTIPLGPAFAPGATAGKPDAVRVIAKVSAGGEAFDEPAQLVRATGALAGDATLYRGRPAATSPLKPVADLQYRRTERAHVEWGITGELDQRSTRLLSRTGQPLAIPVTVTERETGGRKVVAADLNLAPLSAGDYVIELTVGRGPTTEVRLVAFRVIQ